nr:uncharacterized protein LOC101788532 [Cavia porcellus]
MKDDREDAQGKTRNNREETEEWMRLSMQQRWEISSLSLCPAPSTDPGSRSVEGAGPWRPPTSRVSSSRCFPPAHSSLLVLCHFIFSLRSFPAPAPLSSEPPSAPHSAETGASHEPFVLARLCTAWQLPTRKARSPGAARSLPQLPTGAPARRLGRRLERRGSPRGKRSYQGRAAPKPGPGDQTPMRRPRLGRIKKHAQGHSADTQTQVSPSRGPYLMCQQFVSSPGPQPRESHQEALR